MLESHLDVQNEHIYIYASIKRLLVSHRTVAEFKYLRTEE